MSDRLSSIARLQFLGAQRIEIGNEVVTPESERLFAMIVRLSVPLGRMTSRQTMMDTLWPGCDEANSRHNLRQTVYKAREMGLVVESGEDGLRLDPRHWSCDWDDPVGDVGGEWLDGYEPVFSEELMAWVTAQRLGVHALIRPRIIRLLQRCRAAGDLQEANKHATQLLGIDPLNEEATLTRAEAMAMQGAKIDALKLLDGYIAEVGKTRSGRDAALPAQLLRLRIAEKLPAVTYQSQNRHIGPLVGRTTEMRGLTAGLFDARAGRGGSFILHGPEGSGKSRLLHELRTASVLQGMRVLEQTCGSEPNATPFKTLRRIVQRLLECPGALGVSPEALLALRSWVDSREFSLGDCPLTDIEDLLAAVSEDTPLLLLIEHAERIDGESLRRLDEIYRKGVLRYHMLVLASASQRAPTEAPVQLHGISAIPLRPMTAIEVRSVITAWASAEQPRATQNQIGCTAVFAEGNPMFGIEMLGLMLDPGSPDIIPWRVQMAVDRAVRELTEVQLRTLALAGLMQECAFYEVVESVVLADATDHVALLNEMESWGIVSVDDGKLRVSALLSDAAEKRLLRPTLRADALSAAAQLLAICETRFSAQVLYGILKLYVRAEQQSRAKSALDSYAGVLLRADSATSIVFELNRIKKQNSTAEELRAAIDAIVDQVRRGAESRRSDSEAAPRSIRPSSLPVSSAQGTEIEHKLANSQLFAASMKIARDPNTAVAIRLSEAVVALMVASNHENVIALEEAYRAVNSVRHATDANEFDKARADTIYFASKGARSEALAAARTLVAISRSFADVQLSCRGMRNSAEVFAHYGACDTAQSVLLEARALASTLDYHTQVIYSSLKLAELSLDQMDPDATQAYIGNAQDIVLRNSIRAPLIESDIHQCIMWEAILRGDHQRAQKAARTVIRRLASVERSGTALWTILCAKLATRRGAFTREVQRDVATLKDSIGKNPFYRNENFSLATLLLTTRDTPAREEMSDFVQQQFPRIAALGRPIWPLIAMHLRDQPEADA